MYLERVIRHRCGGIIISDDQRVVFASRPFVFVHLSFGKSLTNVANDPGQRGKDSGEIGDRPFHFRRYCKLAFLDMSMPQHGFSVFPFTSNNAIDKISIKTTSSHS